MKGTCGWSAGLGLLLAVAGARAEALPAPPDLEACIAAALEDNPGLDAARARVRAAEAVWAQARSARAPQITASGAFSRTDNPPQAFMMDLNRRALDMADPAFDPNNPDDTDHLRWSLGARWRLWDSGQRAAGISASGRMAGAQAAQEAAARRALAHEVTRGYFSVLQARALARIQDEAIRSLEESLRIAHARLETGSAVKTDVLNLEVKLAEADEGRLRALNAEEIARLALNTAIGRDLVPPGGPAPCTTDLPAEDAPPGGDGSARAELEAARLAREARAALERRARADYGPAINAFGSIDWDSDRFGEYERSYLAGVALEWELFSGGRRAHALAEARARRWEAEADERAARDGVRLDIAQADAGAREARARYAVASKAEESAGEALRITRERYEQGGADISELLNAETALLSARIRRESARYESFVARANQRRARGLEGVGPDRAR
jgi:outer membrane protein